MKRLELFLSSVLAGVLIGVGGAVYLGSGRAPVGAFLFSVALFTICTRGIALYTGRVGYWLKRKDQAAYALELLFIWIGNFAGCMITAVAVGYAKPAYREIAVQMGQTRLQQTPLQTWILAVLCGLLMYIAVDHFRANSGDMTRFLGIFLCVPAFILAGLEHVVADMFFLLLGISEGQTIQIARFLLVCTIGNACGAWLIPAWDVVKTKTNAL